MSDFIHLPDDRLIEVIETTRDGIKILRLDSSRFAMYKTPSPDSTFVLIDKANNNKTSRFKTYIGAEDYALQAEAIPLRVPAGVLSHTERKGEPLWAVGEKNPKGNPNEVFMGNIGPYDIYKSRSGRYAVWMYHPDSSSTAIRIPGQDKDYVPLHSDKEVDLEDIFSYLGRDRPDLEMGVNLEFPGMEIPVAQTGQKEQPKLISDFTIRSLSGNTEVEAWRSREPSARRKAEEDEEKTRELEELKTELEKFAPKQPASKVEEEKPKYYITPSGRKTKYKIFGVEEYKNV